MYYERRYNEILAAIKKLQESNPSDEGIQNWINDNVPELCESEDERIRKKLISLYLIPIHLLTIILFIPLIKAQSIKSLLGLKSKAMTLICKKRLTPSLRRTRVKTRRK